MKNLSKKPFHGYVGMIPDLPLFESLCIADLLNPQSVENFANIFWPHGNSDFCNLVNSYSNPLVELDAMVKRMILEKLGLQNYIDEFLDHKYFLFRFTRYKALSTISGAENSNPAGLNGHTDGTIMTIISQNQVNGLQINKNNEWIDVNISPNSYAVLAGDSFKAWTNGRLHSPIHRVKTTGESDRLSIQLFSLPKPGHFTEAPKELVDEEHPLLFKPFETLELFEYLTSHAGDSAPGETLKAYCGIRFHLGFLDLDVALYSEKPTAITEASSDEEKSYYKHWDRSNRLGLMFMRMNIAGNIKTTLPKTKSAKELLKLVEESSQTADKSLAGILMDTLITMKFNGSRTMHEHVIEMTNMTTRLKSLGMEVE
ncbi:putative secoisolariciresinol dehydrogenase-like [Capsicum annuum]|nr:putative secoisolariciresinol dehydrogenase-like [Capsicum annuum]